MKFFGPQQKNFYCLQGIITSFSHREFKDCLITQKFTLCEVVDFLYNMDIYDTNLEYMKN